MHPGVIGGIAGSVIGVIGGLVGTYCGIRNTNGPRERKFMTKMAVLAWVFVIAFLGLLLLLPQPYRFFAFIPYAIVLPLGVTYCNKTQQKIRQEESQNMEADL